MLVFGLSVQGDNLGPDSEQRRYFIVPAIDFRSNRIDPQPAAFGIVDNEFFIGFGCFLVSETGALIGCRIGGIDSCGGFEEDSDLGHFLQGEVQLFLEVVAELFLSDVVVLAVLLELLVLLGEVIGRERSSSCVVVELVVVWNRRLGSNVLSERVSVLPKLIYLRIRFYNHLAFQLTKGLESV